MDFRWKLPQINAGFVDPEGVRNTMLRKAEIDRAANDMRGYSSSRPEDIRQIPIMAQSASMAMRGYQPNAAMGNIGERSQNAMMDEYRTQIGQERRQMAEQEMQRQELQGRYQQLEQELAQVDAKIAEVKKKYPGITNEREWRIAAKRAEIGDMSAYDNMMARGQNYGEKANGIENMLYDAMKLTWGLGAKSDEDRAFARNQIEVALRKAESEAARTGVKLPAIYDELKASLNPQQVTPGATQGVGGNWAGKNAREIGNELESLKRAKKLHDSDLVELQKIADASSNKEETETIQKLIKEYQGKTVEAGNRYAKKKARGEQLLKEAANQKDVARWYGSLSKSDAEALKTVASVTKDSLGNYTFTKKP